MRSSATANESDSPSWLNGLGDVLDSLSLTPAKGANTDTSTTAPSEAPRSGQPSGYAVVDAFELAKRNAIANGLPVAAAYDTTEKFDYATPLEPTHRQLDAYGALMRRMVMAAQLDDRFVDGRNLHRWFDGVSALALRPEKLRARLQRETGLPCFSTWAQVDASRLAANKAGEGSHLHRVRHQFVNLPEVTLGKVTVDVLDIDPNTQMRRFRVYSDRWADPGFIVRTTLHLQQPLHDAKKGWLKDTYKAPMQIVDGQWKPSQKLWDAIDASSGTTPAQLALTALYLCGDALKSVTQGIVGPAWFSGAQVPEMIQGLLEIAPNNTVTCFTAYELHREAPEGDVMPWFDPGDAQLEQILARGWHATLDKLWVTTPELREALEDYARDHDPTLKIRTIY